MQIRVNETKEANITGRRNDRLFTKGDESVSSICMLVIMETLLDAGIASCWKDQIQGKWA